MNDTKKVIAGILVTAGIVFSHMLNNPVGVVPHHSLTDLNEMFLSHRGSENFKGVYQYRCFNADKISLISDKVFQGAYVGKKTVIQPENILEFDIYIYGDATYETAFENLVSFASESDCIVQSTATSVVKIGLHLFQVRK